ncbi:shikimate kinase [Alteribacter populi]|uniref:shikimate kinase n=1 Tax=Alteribacter populi TaxID=2011011 RepID=UPI000BBA657D|nr:shikimate kinase [Alteribacter populi]
MTTINTNYNVYLVGFMGAGKTTIGQSLAHKLGLDFIDLDSRIEENLNLTIPGIFETYGEKGFRDLETEALRYSSERKAVISTGGGIVEKEINMGIMKGNGRIIFLDAPFKVLYERIKMDPNRPLVKGKREELEERFLKRRKRYEQANYIIDTDECSPKEVVDEIVFFLNE